MAYSYYIVEGTYLVRWGTEGCEYIKPDGTWHEHHDLWDVTTNGRHITDDEEQAMKKAEGLFAGMGKSALSTNELNWANLKKRDRSHGLRSTNLTCPNSFDFSNYVCWKLELFNYKLPYTS